VSSVSLSDLQDETLVRKALAVRGLGEEAAAGKARMFSRATAELSAATGAPAAQAHACFVPGRIEVLGKHTDYAGGRSLLVAVDRGFCVVAVPRRDSRIRILAVADRADITFECRGDIQPQVGVWSNYPMTVARRVARNFPGELRGADIAFLSDLPRSAGMSSSSALIVASYLVLAAINHLEQRREYQQNIGSPLDLAGYLGTIENGLTFGSLAGDRGVGTFGGSEDHTAILFGRPQEIVQYAYCPVRFERSLRLPEGLVFAVADSGIVADKTGAAMDKYNRVARRAAAVVDLWNRETGRRDPHLAAVLAADDDADQRLRTILQTTHHPVFTAEELTSRFEQFLVESEHIIPAVPEDLRGASLRDFGALVDRSQSLGAAQLMNQTAETIWLAQRARETGALAASAFGAGFGGSVWALVPEIDAAAWLSDWSAAYRREFPDAAAGAGFFATRAGPAAFALADDFSSR
jgi:galactokinase